jgi:hypothetical protein
MTIDWRSNKVLGNEDQNRLNVTTSLLDRGLHLMTGFDADRIEMFARTIFGPHLRMTFLERLQKCVCYVAAHPEYIGEIGVIESRTGGILVNHKAFSAFLGLKPNSLARNFRDQHFVLDPSYDPSRELLTRLPGGSGIDTRKWSLRKPIVEPLGGPVGLAWLGRGTEVDDTIDDSVYDVSCIGEEAINDVFGLLVNE